MNQAYFEALNQFLANYWWAVLLIIIWGLFWKGLALWKAARLRDATWFVALLIINTLGILEIVYLLVFSRREIKRAKKSSFTAEEAKAVGKTLGIKWDKYDLEQFRMGMDVELEHGLRNRKTNVTNDNPLLTGKIALAHLSELPDYYTRLEKMEKQEEGKENVA